MVVSPLLPSSCFRFWVLDFVFFWDCSRKKDVEQTHADTEFFWKGLAWKVKWKNKLQIFFETSSRNPNKNALYRWQQLILVYYRSILALTLSSFLTFAVALLFFSLHFHFLSLFIYLFFLMWNYLLWLILALFGSSTELI